MRSQRPPASHLAAWGAAIEGSLMFVTVREGFKRAGHLHSRAASHARFHSVSSV
jgi:hypothetical protein